MAVLTDAEKRAAEERAAAELVKTVNQLGTDFPDLKKEVDGLTAKFKALGRLDEAFKDVDVAKVLENVDKMVEGQKEIRKMIRLSKSGIYVPGLGEDSKDKFSMVRATSAILNKNWNDAPYEEKVFKETREVMKGIGHIVGVDTQGGFFVPDQVIPDVIGAFYATSQLISLDGSGTTRVSVLDGLVGGTVTIPKFIGGMIAYWLGEQDKYIESAVKTGNVSMRPRKLGVLTRITDEMRRFSSYGFEGLMRNDMVRAVASLLDYTIVYGTGTDNMPRGVVNLGGVQVYSAETHSQTLPSGNWSGGELGFDDMMNMQGIIEDANMPIGPSFAWAANPRFFRRRRQDKVQFFSGQTSNFGYLVDGPMLPEDRLRGLIGDYAKIPSLPSTNTPGQSLGKTPNDSNDKKYGDVIGTNWADVVFGRWGGIEITEDLGLGKGFNTDETYIKMRMYGDVGYRNEAGIVLSPDAKERV